MDFGEAGLEVLRGCQVKAGSRLQEWREYVHGGAEGGPLLRAMS